MIYINHTPIPYTDEFQYSSFQMLNLKAPYKTKCGELKLKYFTRYSRHTCWLEQLTDHVNKKCSCKDAFMPGKLKFELNFMSFS